MKLLRTSIIPLLILAAVGCAADVAVDPDAGAPSPPPEVDNRPLTDDAVFTVTGVWANGDGTFRTVEHPITVGEERAQNAARERQLAGGPALLIAQDPACLNASFWLYDRSDWSGNKICFNGIGATDLHLYRRPVCDLAGCHDSSWELTTGSFYAGTSGGALLGNIPDPAGAPKGFDSRNDVAFNIPFTGYKKSTFASPAGGTVLAVGLFPSN
jgi:hypothetical protein